MPGSNIKVPSSGGGEFDCYLAAPETRNPVPALVLASTIRGVDADVRILADEFAASGFLAAAPDLFWRTIPGLLSRHDHRAHHRSQPRPERIRVGESDLADTLTHLGTLNQFNGQAAAMGLCYGGPYAILAPKRLGYAAGISCHGSRMLDYVHDVEDISQPVCLMWGDQDHQAPPELLDAYRGISSRMENVEVHIFRGVLHGYMMRTRPQAFDPAARSFSVARALAILDSLRTPKPAA